MSQSKQLNHTKSQDNLINVGLERFQKVRSSWTTCNNKVQNNSSEVIAKTIDIENIIERLFGQNSDGTLPCPIPLAQMIDLLVEFWEADGLYD